MGCRILDGGKDGAVFYDSVTDWAFGPVFGSAEDAENFLHWLHCDPRVMSEEDLGQSYYQWATQDDDKPRSVVVITPEMLGRKPKKTKSKK